MHRQEVEVFYILPALRKELAKSLRTKKIKQRLIAEMLGVTEAAVSQYLKNKRGEGIKFNKELKLEIKKSADKLIQGESFKNEAQRLLKIMKEKKITCKLCKQYASSEENCNTCFTHNYE